MVLTSLKSKTMPDEPGTSPDAEKCGGNARSHRANNNYHNTQRPRNNIGGLEELTLIMTLQVFQAVTLNTSAY